jgi:hypothetical protein
MWLSLLPGLLLTGQLFLLRPQEKGSFQGKFQTSRAAISIKRCYDLQSSKIRDLT